MEMQVFQCFQNVTCKINNRIFYMNSTSVDGEIENYDSLAGVERIG